MLDVREGLCPARLRGVSCSLYPLRLLKTPIGLTSRFLSSAFDIIFCRSIIIYFDKDTQKRLISRFADLQYSSAYLFSGHSESLQTVSDKYKHVGKTTYKLK